MLKVVVCHKVCFSNRRLLDKVRDKSYSFAMSIFFPGALLCPWNGL